MTIQDDRREKEMKALFALQDGGGRGGTDAYVEIEGVRIPFELKSTTNNAFSTARDLGPDHIEKWRQRHWLFSVYDSTGTTMKHSFYGSPLQMEGWIREKEQYIAPDFVLAACAPELLTRHTVHRILGDKESYSLDDAKKIQKNQYNKEQYKQKMDLAGGYSPQRMLEMVRDRCRYLIERGATLNNPHIPTAYFNGWEKITQNHAARLIELVRLELSKMKPSGG